MNIKCRYFLVIQQYNSRKYETLNIIRYMSHNDIIKIFRLILSNFQYSIDLFTSFNDNLVLIKKLIH